MPNLRIVHLGMNWPEGAIVSAAKFPGGHKDHLSLGAVEETESAITHGDDDLPLPPPPDHVEALAQNLQLRLQVAELEGKLSAAGDELQAARKEVGRLAAVAGEQTALLETLTGGPAGTPQKEDFRFESVGPHAKD